VGALAPHLENVYPEIFHASRVSSGNGFKFEYEGEDYASYGSFVDPAFLKMLTFPFVRGEPTTALSDPRSVVITQRLADRIFGDDDPIGRTLMVGEQVSLTVSGVLQDVPDNSDFDFEFLVSCALAPDAFNKWDVKSLRTFVMLTPGSDHQEVSAKIRNVYNDHNPGQFRNELYLTPLRDMHLRALEGGGLIVYIVIFSALATAVLLVACINFMNLATARSATRHREIGIKKTVGASRRQLIVQFLTESTAISSIALVLAIGLVELLIPVTNAITGSQVSLDFSGTNLVTLFGIGLLTGIVAGAYPALFLSSFQPAVILKGHTYPIGLRCGSGGPILRIITGGSLLRKALVVAQFTVSIALIVGVMVIFGQLDFVRNMDMGFEKDNVVMFNMPRELVPRTQAIKNELLGHARIENVAVSARGLVRWYTSFGIGWEGQRPDQIFDVGYNSVDYDYLETFQMEMAAGRFFSSDFPSDASGAYIVNEAAVRAMEISDPVGRKVTLAPGSSMESHGTIIGVIKDYRTESAHKELRPFILGLTEQGSLMCVRVQPENMASTTDFIRGRIREFAPDADIWFRFFDDEWEQLYRFEGLTGAVVVFVAGIATFITCLGLIGLAAYTTAQRTKEIGIRKVLGATVSSVVRLLSGEFVALTLIASLIACPLSYHIMSRWLENFAHRISLGPGTFVVATCLALLIALVTVTSQARKAASANPTELLRHE
jgi:ABC-type antimicrobial peptide transport system permease subunit